MRTLNAVSLTLICSLGLLQHVAAQNTPPSFQEIERQMMEMQRRMMEHLRNSPFNDPNFAAPQGDTTFFFRFDTTFEGGNMSHFFRFSPFGSDSTNQKGFFGFDNFFDQFFNLDRQFGQPDYGIRDFPKDDGDTPQSDGELLPEEKLRQQEESEKSAKQPPAPKSKSSEPKPDPKVKTIRI